MNGCDIAVIGELVDMFGADVRRHIGGSAVTKCVSDPFIGGGYSAARPGHAHRRADLAAPLDGKLFFAGEACSIDAYATCHGAYLTGSLPQTPPRQRFRVAHLRRSAADRRRCRTRRCGATQRRDG